MTMSNGAEGPVHSPSGTPGHTDKKKTGTPQNDYEDAEYIDELDFFDGDLDEDDPGDVNAVADGDDKSQS
jgi:hypothetical protein